MPNGFDTTTMPNGFDTTTMPNGFAETCDAERISTDEHWAIVDDETDSSGATTASADGPRRRLSANG
ncbi:hypothetical protein RW1_051_00340 [Rhodococcus wratislaviensis NBRC 100605]|uniref:Uncharacterized protein n=1 Tax=Rhodococcus wratislaviensis NBRC 100605 TaxID=1219028 RepID=X0RB72_RHOWR|nr:hypothetical protein RW1_051_00340 [Rhodococcus wratislaviensis NBRC 100605]